MPGSMGEGREDDDVPSPWMERAATLCEEDPRSTYLELLNSQLRCLFPEFLENLRSQTPHQQELSRAAVIEYQVDATPELTIFKDSKALLEYLNTTAVEETPRQRLFLLEDLSLNYIEILGSHLRIPPAYFGAHWADPTTPTFNYRNPFARFSEQTFAVRYATTQPVHIEAPSDLESTVYSYLSNVNRHVHCYDPKGPIIDQPKSYHTLSFWTSGARDDGSWDSLLTLDPPVGSHVKSLKDGTILKANHNSSAHAYNRMHSLAPDVNATHILSEDASTWHDGWIQPRYESLFDDILTSTQASHFGPSTPRGCTETARKIVIAIFITFLRRRILNMLRLQANPCAPAVHVNRCDYLRQFGHGMLSSWQHELFGFVVNVKYIMGIMLKEAEDNVVALGLDRPHTGTSVVVPEWEVDGWIAIREHCTKIIVMAEAFLQSYLQFTSMQEAQAANNNAMSLSRITNLTMIFVPLSTIAAIFSMSDDFMPGRNKSWIFWVTAMPILVVVFSLTTEARALMKQYWRTCQARENKEALEARTKS